MNHNEQNSSCHHPLYAIFTLLFIISSILLAIISLDTQNLVQLSMPRTSNGQICEWPLPYLHISSIDQRSCVRMCPQPEKPIFQLGGICMSNEKEYILKERGEYEEIQSKRKTLQRLKILTSSILICGIVSILFAILLFCGGETVLKLVLVLSLLLWIGLLYLIYSAISWLVLLSFGLVLYVWIIFRNMYSDEIKNIEFGSDKQNCTAVFGSIGFTILFIVTIAIFFFSYLSVISSQKQSFQNSKVFATIPYFSWKEGFVVLSLFIMLSLTFSLYQFLIGGYYATSTQLYCTPLLHHFGSICKFSLIKLIFFLPFAIIQIFRPTEKEPCAQSCHCFCGYALNMAKKYSLPVLPYIYLLHPNQPINLSKAAYNLSIEWHEYRQSSKETIYKISSFVFLMLIGMIWIIWGQKQRWELKYEEVDVLLLVIGGVLGGCMSIFLMGGWKMKMVGSQLREVCMMNRSIQIQN